MTKRIRVENADTSSYKVLVQVWDKVPENEPDNLVREIVLANPCGYDRHVFVHHQHKIFGRERSIGRLLVVE